MTVVNNQFTKYCPNVFVVKSNSQYKKGDVCLVTTKFGCEVECLIHNLVAQRDGIFYYSQTRVDGTNNKTRAKSKSEKYEKSAERAIDKSQEYWEKSKKGASFLSLGEPIKVGHHSESRHRKLIENNWNNLGKSVEADELAKTYEEKSSFWDKKAKVIDLSMPESVEFFRQKLQEAIEFRDGMKSGKIPREHSFSLSYATKNVNDLTKKVETAMKLWGDSSTPAAPVEIPAAPAPVPTPEPAPVAPAFELSAPAAPVEISVAPAKKSAAPNPAERAEVMRASFAAAESFELGGDPLDNLTGQTALFF